MSDYLLRKIADRIQNKSRNIADASHAYMLMVVSEAIKATLREAALTILTQSRSRTR